MRNWDSATDTICYPPFCSIELTLNGLSNICQAIQPKMVKTSKSLLVRLRSVRGISQEKLADALGVTTHTISNWEVGRSIPKLTPRQYKTLLKVLHITSDQLPDNFGPQGEGASLLKQLRELAGLTESDLARELSIQGNPVSTESVLNWEQTGELPRLSIFQLAALCDALSISARQLADYLKPLDQQEESEA